MWIFSVQCVDMNCVGVDMLPIAGGAVHGDQRGEDTHQEQDQHHVLSKPAAIVSSCIALYFIVRATVLKYLNL